MKFVYVWVCIMKLDLIIVYFVSIRIGGKLQLLASLRVENLLHWSILPDVLYTSLLAFILSKCARVQVARRHRAWWNVSIRHINAEIYLLCSLSKDTTDHRVYKIVPSHPWEIRNGLLEHNIGTLPLFCTNCSIVSAILQKQQVHIPP